MACTQRRAHSRRDAARPQSVRSARSCGSKPAAIKTRVARGRLAGPRCGQRPLVPGLAIAAGCGGAAPTGAARGERLAAVPHVGCLLGGDSLLHVTAACPRQPNDVPRYTMMRRFTLSPKQGGGKI